MDAQTIYCHIGEGVVAQTIYYHIGEGVVAQTIYYHIGEGVVVQTIYYHIEGGCGCPHHILSHRGRVWLPRPYTK